MRLARAAFQSRSRCAVGGVSSRSLSTKTSRGTTCRRATSSLAATESSDDATVMTSESESSKAKASATTWKALVLSGGNAPEECAQNSSLWIAAAPRGAYTVARTVANRTRIFELGMHVDRVLESASLMGRSFKPETVGPAIRTAMADAVEAAEGRVEGATDEEGGELKVTVLLTWDDDEGEKDTSASAEDSTSSDGGNRNAAGEEEGAIIALHISPLPPRPKPPVTAMVAGAPRTNAAAKDSEWVRSREGLEAAGKAGGYNEVILHDEASDELLEGLSSNFFAVDAEGKLHTAPDGEVLAGTVRKIILEACETLGVQVVLSSPKLKDADTWRGVLVSSTSRLALPLCRLDWSGTTKEFDPSDPIVSAIDKEVMNSILSHSDIVAFDK